ncbi:MAG: DEAD/DEAH box helicase [Candidatus Omnitrophica bacterium]|nr:DEAD/DEAH box helicase [Candidatus Omnitrophota bacterium]
MKTFNDLGLSESTLQVLKHKGFEHPTKVQEEAIPVILGTKKDVLVQAQTGTGKTAAFGLPIIEQLRHDPKGIQVLVLTPTRELAIQVTEELTSFTGRKKIQVVPIYGGQSIDLQLRRLKKGVDIVVATPGRVIDHLKRKTISFAHIDYLVLDEADEMLNMGFQEDVEEILKYTGQDKRVFLFSATMPAPIRVIATRYMREYESIKVTQGQLTTARTDQIYFEVSRHQKFEALCRIIDIEEEFYGLVFCRTKVDVDEITTHLQERGYDAEGLHGDISQNRREKILAKFKKRIVNILVATDVAARGIDVQDLTHVINYALPQDSESYVHRVGRTGRAGKEGNAITFVTPSEYRKLKDIQKQTKTDIRREKLPTAKTVVETKRKRIKQQLADMIKENIPEDYQIMSQELLHENNAQDILAALLNFTFKDELKSKSYADIEERNIDANGTTRLFIKQGKHDGYNKKKLVDLIVKKCGFSKKKIRDVLVLDSFSFITLPFHEGEIVLSFFKKNKKQNIIVQKAKDK